MLARGWTARVEYLWTDHQPSIETHGGFDDGPISSGGLFTTRFGLTKKFGSHYSSSCCESVCDPCCVPWKGFYIGGHTGHASSDISYAEFGPAMGGGPNPEITSFNPEGAIGGFHLGYNWQRENLVYGVEADWTSLQADDRVVTGNGNVTRDVDISWVQSVRGRVGYGTGCVLAYGTAGLAFTETKTFFENPGGPSSQSTFDTSFVVGGGLELAVYRNWNARLEYLYVAHDPSFAAHAGFDQGPNSSDGIYMIRVGLNRNFRK